MVIETEQIAFLQWLPLALRAFFEVVVSLSAVAVVVGYIVAALRYGPIKAVSITAGTIFVGIADLLSLSPRRVAALAWLAVKDSIRRRVLVVFAVFILIILFAGWFLDPASPHPLRLYISFVLPATSYLVLALVLFLSVFSIPADLKSKTLHTVVTKPVHASEIVLGRMLGYVAVGTILLAVMGTISYVFVLRGLNHTHTVKQADLQAIVAGQGDLHDGNPAAADGGPLKGKSSRSFGHRHEVEIDSQGNGQLKITHDHWHPLVRRQDGDKTIYDVGPPEGMLVARVPVYGQLRFLNRQGKPAKKGINVGDEWTYRSYVEGGSLGAAIWRFQDVSPENFPEELQLEMTLGIFRSHKGKIDEGIPGSLLVRNPKTGLTLEAKIFTAQEFETDVQIIPRVLRPSTLYYLQLDKDAEGRLRYVRSEVDDSLKNKPSFDLFEDMVDDGRLEIWLQCLASGQYLGAAQADLYIHARNASFGLNFVKGYLGAWMQMVLVAGFGIMFSTFLSGPIAMLATVGALIGGIFRSWVLELALGKNYGGGPTESIIRIFTHQNIISEAEPGLRSTVAQMFDAAARPFLWTVAQVLPEFNKFSCADYLAYGFNIPSAWICEQGLTVFGFFFLLFVAGSFLLKTREVAK